MAATATFSGLKMNRKIRKIYPETLRYPNWGIVVRAVYVKNIYEIRAGIGYCFTLLPKNKYIIEIADQE